MLTPSQEARDSERTLHTADDNTDERNVSPLGRAVLFGGQDTPSLRKLVGTWQAYCSPQLPAHVLTATEWPTLPDTGPAQLREQGATQELEVHPAARARSWSTARRLPRWLERLLAALAAGFVSFLDRNMVVASDAKPQNLCARLVGHYTRFTLTVLYGRCGLGRRVLAQAVAVLRSAPVDIVVGHSLGGTLAFLAAWELWRSGDSRRFALVTLGTSSGHMVERSGMLAGIPRNPDGSIARPPNVTSWVHYWSRNDVLVAAPTLPEAFAGVDLVEVDTGPLSHRGRAHALAGYLSTPEVRRSLRDTLLRAVSAREKARD